jgi:hypothetical protein
MQVIVHSLINAPEHNNATAMLENFDASTGVCVCVLCVCVLCVCVCVRARAFVCVGRAV